MRLIAHQAARFGVDPTRIGAMGLSAGGHLCANLAAQFTRAAYKPTDAADALSARLCIAAPIYAAILADQFTSPGLFGANSTAEMLAQHTPAATSPPMRRRIGCCMLRAIPPSPSPTRRRCGRRWWSGKSPYSRT